MHYEEAQSLVFTIQSHSREKQNKTLKEIAVLDWLSLGREPIVMKPAELSTKISFTSLTHFKQSDFLKWEAKLKSENTCCLDIQ